MARITKPVMHVALIGAAGCGKTTHARALQAAVGGDVLSFAGKLKKITTELFGEKMADEEFSRTANQVLGVAARGLDEDVWVRAAMNRCPDNRSVFVDDCRFHNEYRELKRRGFVFIRLLCNPQELAVRRPFLTPAQAQHVSEQEQAMFFTQYHLRTDDGSVEEIHGRLLEFLIEYYRTQAA